MDLICEKRPRKYLWGLIFLSAQLYDLLHNGFKLSFSCRLIFVKKSKYREIVKF